MKILFSFIIMAILSWPTQSALVQAQESQNGIFSTDLGLRVTGAIAQFDAIPGETYVHRMVVHNTSDEKMRIEVKAFGLGQTLDGAHMALNENDSTLSPYSGYPFISDIDIQSFDLVPGGKQVVQATITIPQNAAEKGGKYAVIHFRPIMEMTKQVVFVPEIYVPVVLDFGSWDIKGKITDARVVKIESGSPILCEIILQNTGNYHYRAQSNAVLKDAQGNTVAEATSPLTRLSLIPSYSYRFQLELAPEKPLPVGRYKLEVKTMLSDGSILDTYETDFEVAKKYVRFMHESEVSVGINWMFLGGTVVFIAGIAFFMLSLANRRKRY